MKLIVSKYFFFAAIMISLIVIGVDIMVFKFSDVPNTFNLNFIIMQFFLLSPIILFILMRRQVLIFITIDKIGVRVSCIRTFASIKWEDMAEVGIGTHNDPVMAYTWIYFSKKPLSDKEIVHMQGIKQNNEGIKVRFSKKALKAVRKYYRGEIRNLTDDMKGYILL